MTPIIIHVHYFYKISLEWFVMKKIKIVMLIAFAYLLLACSIASNNQEDIKDSESITLSLLMNSSDIVSYDCKWVNTLLAQTHDPDDFQAKGSDESANILLDGTCFNPGGAPFHITLRHELYLYKTSEPAEVSFYLAPLSEDANWRNFDLGIATKYKSLNKCASYKESQYQDCFFILQHSQIISVVWINSSRELQDLYLKTIAVDIISNVEKRILAFVKKS